MASKNYYFVIVFGTLLIVATAIGLGISLKEPVDPFICIIIVMSLLVEIFLLIFNLNSINRKIATYFNAIQNEDTSIFLPEKSKNKSVREIQQAMNKVVDIFQKIKMESEIRQQFFSAMIEHSSTGFISIDEHGDFEIINETARKLLGVDYTSNMERLQKESSQLYKTLINLKHGEVKSCRIDNAEVPTTVQVSSSYISFKNKNLTLISMQDIQKEIESRELESWQKLIRILNHEIMNSIAPITSVSKSLKNIIKPKENPVKLSSLDENKICDLINGLEVIESMSAGLSNFVNHYRQLSKIPEPILRDIDVKLWSEKIYTISKDCIEENNALLEVVVRPGCVVLSGDENLLNQVLINLIKNAAEAPIRDEKKKIMLEFLPSVNNRTIIKVWNNGELIQPEIIDQIFVPFFTTKEKGAGIGLFVSRQIINLHQGTISVTSTQNEGTFFCIEL
jgi:nitrogen fixation/metabolism regulation signal transduction histidine kinase